MGADSSSDATVLRDAVSHAVRFTYRNSLVLVGVSLAWFVAVLPVVTFGPATVGAYRAVIGLRDPEPLDVRAVLTTVRRQFVHAVLLGLLPIMFWSVALFYAIQYPLTDGTIALVLFLAAFYIGTYLAMLSIPAFVALAHGEHGYDAVSFGYTWLREHVTLALMTVIVTGVFTLVLAVLTIAFPVLFGGLAAAFHVEIVDETYAAWTIDGGKNLGDVRVDEADVSV